MFDFFLFLLGMVPWPVWAVLALVAVCLIQFVFGWKATIAAAVSLLPILGYFYGKRRQSEIDQAQRDRDALRDARFRREVDDDVADMGAQDVADELARWNRDRD